MFQLFEEKFTNCKAHFVPVLATFDIIAAEKCGKVATKKAMAMCVAHLPPLRVFIEDGDVNEILGFVNPFLSFDAVKAYDELTEEEQQLLVKYVKFFLHWADQINKGG